MESNAEFNFYEILQILTINKDYESNDIEDKLQETLNKVFSFFPEDSIKTMFNEINNTCKSLNIRYQYIHMIKYVLQKMKTSTTRNDNVCFSVEQFRIVKSAIEFIVLLGVIPCLLPGLSVNMKKLYPQANKFDQENITVLQKYEQLVLSTYILIECFNEPSLKPAVLNQIGPLLVALLQLSYAPLMKPREEVHLKEKQIGSDFVMTTALYKTLKMDQEEFKIKLSALLDNCPQFLSIRELMVIFGLDGTPKWLRKEIQKHLVEKIMQPNGVIAIISAVCDNMVDLGIHWDKLDTVTKLIAKAHGSDPNEYYKAVCPQLIDLLKSRKILHSVTIANCCITALYENNPTVCKKYIIEIIYAPLLTWTNDEKKIEKFDDELEECIDTLTNIFTSTEARFKVLPCKLLSGVALPLFCLHNRIRQSIRALKTKVKQLLLILLQESSMQKRLFSAFLGYSTIDNHGENINSQFTSNGGLDITGIDNNSTYEEYAESLLNLAIDNDQLSVSLFTYLLECLIDLSKSATLNKEENSVKVSCGIMEQFEKRLIAMKLLSNLANRSITQETQVKNPEHLFCFIKSLFDRNLSKDFDIPENENCEALYIGLMLIKLILSEGNRSLSRTPFNDFASFLKECKNSLKMPVQLAILIQEVIDLINSKVHHQYKCYENVSIDSEVSGKFENAIKDLSNSMLPVRAHGLISLMKLVESMDPYIAARKIIIFRLFQENLKHEDSFIYLAAINGMCTLAVAYPDLVIDTLVQEYIDIDQRITTGEITTETRIKLGEILVKATKGLGEMVSVHKNTLINGFLCAVRDPDPLVRASSLSCLGELCKVLGFRLGSIVTEVIYCVSCIIKSDKAPECRRAAVLVATLLLRGLGKDILTNLEADLIVLYRGLKNLRDNDKDSVLCLHATLALEEINDVMENVVFSSPKLEKTIFLLDSL